MVPFMTKRELARFHYEGHQKIPISFSNQEANLGFLKIRGLPNWHIKREGALTDTFPLVRPINLNEIFEFKVSHQTITMLLLQNEPLQQHLKSQNHSFTMF